jgi:amino acid adenylation domain-containing protein
MSTEAYSAPADDDTWLPITESQKGLLVVEHRVSSHRLYNELVQFDLDPHVSDDDLARALAAVVAVQPALRQVFGLRPRMHARLTAPLTAAQLRVQRVVVAPRQFGRALRTTARQLGLAAFDLEHGPAYRFATVRTSDGGALALLLCDHHIVLDGTSLEPLVRDLEAALSGDLGDADIPGKRMAREAAFVREVQAQTRSAGAASVEARSAAWVEQLRDVGALVLSPRPGRPTQTDFTGARVAWELTEEECHAFTDSCRRLDITPFAALTGLYAAVLARHSGVQRVLVGCPFMARRTVTAFDLAGFFVNTLPISIDVDWSQSVAQHLGQTTRAAVDFCRSNLDVPLSRLVAQVGPDRSSDRNPLFCAMIVMQDTAPPGAWVRGVTELGNDTAKFDLRLSATQVGERWVLSLEYDRQLISGRVADELLRSLRGAVVAASGDQSLALSDLFQDASAIASVRSDGWSSRLRAGSAVEWVDAAAASTPTAPAVQGPSATMTYAELTAATARVASALAERGAGEGSVIGIATDDLCDSITAMLGILRCGAAYLPLDVTLPQERLAYMVDKAGCTLIVGRAVLPDVPAVSIAELTSAERCTPGPGRAPSAPHDTPVYVMFTSGSTGRPKGVLMGSKPLANLTAWQIAALEMDADTRFLQYAPLSFDVSFQEIMPTLACGGTVVSREPADRRSLSDVLERIATARITHLYLPVPALRPLLELARSLDAQLPALRFICVAGEQLLVDDGIREFFLDHPQCQLVNLYGPTETHAVTSYRLRGGDVDWPAHVPIGLPYPGVAAYVVDSTGHLAPAGVPGELYLGGACPALGYINDPDLTAARFVPDRFSPDAEARMYRTGDLVVRSDNADLIFLGRVDRQVKIRGYRIELGEIESVAGQVSGVRQAAAVIRGHGADAALVLFVLGEAQSAPDIGALRSRLASALPEYMRPAHIFTLDQIPTTPSGKTDRDALVRLTEELLDRQQSGLAAPETVGYVDELEGNLAALWSAVLECEPIPRERPVFEFGAHSLNTFTVLAEIQERYGVAVPVVEFFSSPTIATLARLVRVAGLTGEEAAI